MIIKNIESKIRLATWVAVGSFFTAVLLVSIVSFFAYRQTVQAMKNVYILDANNVPLSAQQSNAKMNRPAEYRTHINLFHSLFFTLTPDEKFIEYQMKKAMYLADESGALQYNNLKEKGFFNSILSSNAVLTIQTDSIYLNKDYFRFYGKQTIDRRSSTVVRSLITEGYLRDLEIRTENNAHAVLITRWKTLENKDLSYVPKNNL